ncbi:uncharacterized protein METZ01_LOCUS323016, partial [marine metagenome]
QECVDTLIMIPNQNLFRVANENTTFADAFRMADDVLYSGVRGVTDLMVMPGMINLDFQDVRSVMNEMGKAMMGTGEAEGERRALDAAESAINNPLLDDVSLMGARGVLINITGGPDMTLYEEDEACNHIREQVDDDANIIFGSTFDEELSGRVRVSVVATGIDVQEPSLDETNSRNNTGEAVPTGMTQMGVFSGNAAQTVPVPPNLSSRSLNSTRATTVPDQYQRVSENTVTTFAAHSAQRSADLGSSAANERSPAIETTDSGSAITGERSEDITTVERARGEVPNTSSEDVSVASTPELAGEASDMSDRKGLFSRMARSALPRQFSAPTHPTRSTTREPVLETVE